MSEDTQPEAQPGEYRSVMLKPPALSAYLGYAPINPDTQAWDAYLNSLTQGGWVLRTAIPLDHGWVLLTWQKEKQS